MGLEIERDLPRLTLPAIQIIVPLLLNRSLTDGASYGMGQPTAVVTTAFACLLVACGGPAPASDGALRSGTASRDSGYALRQAPSVAPNTSPRDTLRPRRTFGDSLAFARIVKLYTYPGKVLGLDQLLQYHLTTIDLEDGSIQHFGRNGEGPREMRTPFSASFSAGSEEVWSMTSTSTASTSSI